PRWVFILGMNHFLLCYLILFFVYWVKHNEHLTTVHFRSLPNSCDIFTFFSEFFYNSLTNFFMSNRTSSETTGTFTFISFFLELTSIFQFCLEIMFLNCWT